LIVTYVFGFRLTVKKRIVHLILSAAIEEDPDAPVPQTATSNTEQAPENVTLKVGRHIDVAERRSPAVHNHKSHEPDNLLVLGNSLST
jgi:hypothetical protein